MTTPLSHDRLADLDCTTTVHAIVVRFPATARVFNAFGIDLCCGASLSVHEAARASGIEQGALCSALRDALTA